MISMYNVEAAIYAAYRVPCDPMGGSVWRDCVSRVPAWRACAGATASGECTLCQAGSYQTGSGQLLLQYILLLHPCVFLWMGWFLSGFGFTCMFRTCAGATALGTCTLCQAGTYQTGSGCLLLPYTLTKKASKSGRRAYDSMPRLLWRAQVL